MKDIRELPVIMISMSRWDSPLSSAAYSLARELAKTNKVFYFDYPYTLKDYWKGRKDPSLVSRKKALLKGGDIYTNIPGEGPNLKAVTPRIVLPFYFLSSGKLYDLVVKINNRRLFKTIRKVLDDHGIEGFIFFNSFNPFYGVEMPAALKPNYFVYQCRDNLRATPGLEIHGTRGERIAAKNADLVIATSSRLREILREETGREVFLLPNAAETGLFKTTVTADLAMPEDFPDNGKKVVGFVGNIGPRMDLELVRGLLESHPDKDFVMIGPDNLHEFEGSDIRNYPNLYLPGPKKLNELPAYLKYMDVTIIPFLKDELTRSIYPLKLHEQLAAGRPIVTTDFSEDVRAFSDIVYVVGSHAEFIGKIDVAISENSAERVRERMKRSKGNSWADRVEQFWGLLESVSQN